MAADKKTIEEFCRRKYDYLIVGGGTAGLVLASRLSEDPFVTVGVLEAGELQLDGPTLRKSSVGFYPMVEDLNYDWGFQTEPQRHAHGIVYDLPSGKILGGSSVTNHNLFTRGCKTEYDDWETLGNPGWNLQGLLPYFSKAEAQQPSKNGNPTFGDAHGSKESEVAKQVVTSTANDIAKGNTLWHNAWAELGISGGPKQPMETIVSSVAGTRTSSVEAYYLPVMHRGNLHVLTTVLASSVTFSTKEGSKLIATGVEFLNFDDNYRCEASLENLQDHAYTYSLLELETEEHSLDKNFGKLQIGETSVKESDSSSATGLTLSTFVTYEHAAMGRVPPPPELILDAIQPTPDDANNFVAVLYSISTPFSRGAIHIESSDPRDYPTVDPSYLEHPLDMRLLRAATRLSLDLICTGALSSVTYDIVVPYQPMITEQNYDEHACETCESYFHPVGTCAMMPREDGGVVDPNLIVYGTENLRVVDSSIIPLHISGDIEWTVYAIAEKAADMIKDQRHMIQKII
uniref:Choline dehydrogenase n=1 Tax=Coccidioides posadasii RMSCC 3488 TaxID=454284 RepID=A0A0J6FIN3_COCPO|nr:choline dehydrogenase [Coccidioides posadasii RMSCC 3488]